MQTGADQLVVRQHQRLVCCLRASLIVSPAHAKMIVLSRTTADSAGGLSATVVDCSRGGVGLHVPVLLPRTSLVSVQIPMSESAAPAIVLHCRVQRATMSDRKPTYYLGLSFRTDENDAAQVDRLLALAGAGPASTPAGTAGSA